MSWFQPAKNTIAPAAMAPGRPGGRRAVIMTNRVREALFGYLFVLPSVLGCAVFVIAPFAGVLYRSFTLGMTGAFNGVTNYIDVIGNQAFSLALGNTLRFIGICLPLLLLVSLSLALTLNKTVFGRSALRAAFLLPLAIPVASVALLWQVLFHNNGLIGGLLELAGLDRIDWMNSDWAMGALVVSYIWKNIGYDMVLFLAGLSNISPALYEAASVDGATPIKQFFFITLPSLRPTLFTVVVLSLLNSFKVYREAYLVAGDYPHSSIYLIQHTLNNWFAQMEIEKLSAAATLTAVVIVALVALLNKAWSTDHE